MSTPVADACRDPFHTHARVDQAADVTDAPSHINGRFALSDLPIWRERRLRVLVLLHLLVVLVTAWRSETFFHPDEHFQVVEFASHLLGWTPADALPWEFAAQMRPWLQPLAYAGLMRGDRKSTRLNSSHITRSRMPSSA